MPFPELAAITRKMAKTKLTGASTQNNEKDSLKLTLSLVLLTYRRQLACKKSRTKLPPNSPSAR